MYSWNRNSRLRKVPAILSATSWLRCRSNALVDGGEGAVLDQWSDPIASTDEYVVAGESLAIDNPSRVASDGNFGGPNRLCIFAKEAAARPLDAHLIQILQTVEARDTAADLRDTQVASESVEDDTHTRKHQIVWLERLSTLTQLRRVGAWFFRNRTSGCLISTRLRI